MDQKRPFTRPNSQLSRQYVPHFINHVGWSDKSWRNDVAPLWLNEATGLTVRVSVADPAARPPEMPNRFIAQRMHKARDGWTWLEPAPDIYAGNDADCVLIVLVGEAFAAVVRDWLTPEQMGELQRANVEYDTHGGGCASHDFCDANMAVDRAFKTILGRSCWLDSDANEGRATATEVEDDCLLWNAASAWAKPRHLTLRRQMIPTSK